MSEEQPDGPPTTPPVDPADGAPTPTQNPPADPAPGNPAPTETPPTEPTTETPPTEPTTDPTPPSEPVPEGTAGFTRVDRRDGASGILIWAEVAGAKLSEVTLEILGPALEIKQKLGCQITVAVGGKQAREFAGTLIDHGADKVIICTDHILDEYLVLPQARFLETIIKDINPEILLMGATTSGRELAPRVASRVRAGVTADCTVLDVGDFVYRRKQEIRGPCLLAIRPSFGESKLATIVGFWMPQMATARPGTFRKPVPIEGRMGDVREIKVPFTESDAAVTIKETTRATGGSSALDGAELIVAGGLPAGEGDKLKLIHALVTKLQEKGIKAEWAASRLAVDHGFAPHARQVGQTGRTVRPKVYIAVAVSGAIQHIAGMKESGKVIAINSDAAAPIFKEADYGIVGDYKDIIPALIDQVEKGFKFGL